MFLCFILQVLLQQCVKPYSESLTSEDSSKVSASNQAMTAIQKMVKSLESGLSYQFHSVWPQVLQLWSEMFLVVGPVAPKVLALLAHGRYKYCIFCLLVIKATKKPPGLHQMGL